MDVQQIIVLLEDEKVRLDRAILALQGATGKRSYTRRAKRGMTAAGKKRISIAMKKRWAERKKVMKAAA